MKYMSRLLEMKLEQESKQKPKYPMEQWGKDHWSTFAYIHNRCVNSTNNGVGIPEPKHIQCNLNRHPGLIYSMFGDTRSGEKYGIRLKDRELPGLDYDEWDCIEDIVNEGLLKDVGTGINPAFKMTDFGNHVISILLKHKTKGGYFSDFNIGDL